MGDLINPNKSINLITKEKLLKKIFLDQIIKYF